MECGSDALAPVPPFHHLPSRSESPGIARSVASLTLFHASRLAFLALSQVRLDVPRDAFQSRDKVSDATERAIPGDSDRDGK